MVGTAGDGRPGTGALGRLQRVGMRLEVTAAWATDGGEAPDTSFKLFVSSLVHLRDLSAARLRDPGRSSRTVAAFP